MGPSGAGKSSLLNVLAMLDDQWKGEFFFEGAAVHRDESQAAGRAGAEEDWHGVSELSPAGRPDGGGEYRSAAFVQGHLQRSERQALVADTLDRFNIVGKKDLFPAQLSGGQQQLVGIARAVIHKPESAAGG